MKEFHCTSVKNNKRSIKNKNMSTDLLLMSMFRFDYAGKAQVFIHKRFDKFELVVSGVHIVEDIYAFSKNYTKRYKFNSLYYAVLGFNTVVQIITNSMDWFNKECFQGSEVYNELFIED